MRISAVCPVYNTPPPLLNDAVASVLADPAVLEVVLVDDGSSDPATLAALAALDGGDGRVVVSRIANGGPGTARNAGLARARGEWIGFLDSDDLWLPGRPAAFGRILGAEPGAAWMAGRHLLLYPDGAQEAPPPLSWPDGTASQVAPGVTRVFGAEVTRLLLGDSRLHLGSMLVKRELLLQAGGFHEGSFFHEDTLLIAKLSTLAPLWATPAMVYGWRRGRDSLTVSPRRLSAASLTAYAAARTDPLLRGFRREARWAHYSALKGVALNNLLAGRRGAALGFALQAWMIDPRSLPELGRFLALARMNRAAAADAGRAYSLVDQFVTRETPRG